MFDITGEDILLLNDEDLRELIGRLCEAEVQKMNLSPLAVTYGGNQNAKDGGIDVRVTLPVQPVPGCAIVRSHTGFQSKAEDMPRGSITDEMKPGGNVRASIVELANLGGSYIIVSSKGSVSDSSLNDRLTAMTDAVSDLPNAASLHLAFYDRNRLATWVRDNSGLASWAREKIGRALSGWRPYGDWPVSNEGETTYLVDEKLRIQGPETQGQGDSALAGIEQIRTRLTQPKGIVRLVGLSGTGKTRLAQALFDRRIGEGGLAPSLAIYTNLSDDPSPQPIALASNLIAEQKRYIMVVDNCPPELHGRLSALCRAANSTLSLLTIEYDVRDDQPEGTEVFELQPASDDLIEKLLQRRVPDLSQVNSRSVAKFASGNARVAIALASTIDIGETVAELRDHEVFQRLFRQRRSESESLLQTAQACSLVYSFQGEDTSEGETAELWMLADLFDRDVRSIHPYLVELQPRDLLQRRGSWRALLPHAIANRLAVLALGDIFS